MSLSFEPNLKRRFHRVTVPLFVRVGEVAHKATDWSVGGFRIDNYLGELKPGSEFDCTLLLPYSEFSVHLPVKARVARRDKTTVGCSFINLTAAQQAALHHLVEAALEGRMGDLGETLGALRSPVLEAEKKLIEDAEATSLEVKKLRLLPKAVAFVATVSAVVFFAGGIIYYLASRLRVPDGVIVGNLVRVASESPGRLARVRVAEGQTVRAGEPLFEMENPDLRAALATAQSKLRTTQAEFQAAEGQLEEEKARVGLYARIAPLQIARMQSNIRQIEARARPAKSELDRYEKLARENIGSQSDYERSLSVYESLLAEREQAGSDLSILRLNESAVKDGLYFDGKEIHGRVKELQEHLAVSRSQLSEAQQASDRAKAKVDDLTIKAPSAGKIYSVLHPVGESLTAPTAVISLHSGEGCFAIGNLNADEAVKVKPGMPVKVYIPTLKLQLAGKVTQIGQQAPMSGAKNSAEMETQSRLVPVKVTLNELPPLLPPGIRAILVIRTDPWMKLFTF